MRSAGPLQELPIELFTTDTDTPAKSARPNKRSGSPGVSSLYSPAKRRILNEEGINSPRKMTRTPLAFTTPSRFATVHFNELLKGPDSPARKLDFGSSKAAVEKTPIARSDGVHTLISAGTSIRSDKLSSSTSVLPSDKFGSSSKRTSTTSTSSRSSTQIDTEMTDYFMSHGTPSSSCRSTPPLVVCEISADHYSVHYPGFDVFQETSTAITVECLMSEPDDMSLPVQDIHEDKENIAPRKKLRKTATAPAGDAAWEKAGLLSPRGKLDVKNIRMTQSIPLTPRAERTYGEPRDARENHEGSATPTTRALRLLYIPGSKVAHSSPQLSADIRKERRRMIEEADDMDESDDDKDLAF